MAEWNVEHRIFQLDSEIEQLLVDKKIDIIFLTEVDTKNIDDSYKILDYHAIIPDSNNKNKKKRIVGLVKDSIMNDVKVRRDLMIENYPIIWIEVDRHKRKNWLIAGLYRTWGEINNSMK